MEVRDESRSHCYLRELDALRGRTAWIAMTHTLPQFRERELLLGILMRLARGAAK